MNYQVVCCQWEELVLEKLFPDEKVCSGIVCEQSREIFGQLNRNVYLLLLKIFSAKINYR